MQRLCDIIIADLARFPIDHKTLLLKNFDECCTLETAEVFYEMHFWCCFSWVNHWVLHWVTGCCRETWFFTFIPGRTLLLSMCDIRINLRYAGSVFPLALKIQTQSGRRRDWSQLRPRSRFSERGRQRPLFISFFSMAAELWTRSLFVSSNKFKCNQVLFKGRHSSCEQACVHNVLCTAHFWLYSCRLSSRCRVNVPPMQRH